MNRPTIDSTFCNSGGLPETVDPKTTSFSPLYLLNNTDHTPCIRVLVVMPICFVHSKTLVESSGEKLYLYSAYPCPLWLLSIKTVSPIPKAVGVSKPVSSLSQK